MDAAGKAEATEALGEHGALPISSHAVSKETDRKERKRCPGQTVLAKQCLLKCKKQAIKHLQKRDTKQYKVSAWETFSNRFLQVYPEDISK